MLYFILWAVFALAIVVAVPIAHLIDQRGQPQPEPAAEGGLEDEDFGDEDLDEAGGVVR